MIRHTNTYLESCNSHHNDNVLLHADAQIKSLYVLATQGQGQLVLYTGLRHQTTYQGNSGEDQTDYILPISAEP